MAENWRKIPLPTGPSNLCFNKDEFMKENLNIDRFVSDCRKHVPLETLREDLGLYLRLLRTAMIELINQDYADFVNLSGNLVGFDKAIGNILLPLGQLKEEVMSVKSLVAKSVIQIEDKLNHRKNIQDNKAILQQLITSVQCIEKIENLLTIPPTASHRVDHNSKLFESSLDGNLMERVATEFNQLQFVVKRTTELQLVKNMKPRILQITTTLQNNLEGAFLSSLKSRDREQLDQCLRIYAAIDKTRDAEELFRKKIVAPYMESIINEKVLKSHPQGLKGMYTNVLEFIPKHCSDLTTITNSASGKDSMSGFDFLVNAVWPEVVDGIQFHVPMLWDLTNPEAFHEQYLVSMDFLDKFEESCETISTVMKLREQESYAMFMNKWNIAVYFQIRFQEIAGKLESSLDLDEIYSEKDDYLLPQTRMLWECIHACWCPETLLRPLTYRFWKLFLLLLSRYTIWISETFCFELTSLDPPKDAETSQAPLLFADSVSDKPANGGTEKSTADGHSGVPLQRIVALSKDIDRVLCNIPVYIKDIIEPHLSAIQESNIILLNESVDEICSELTKTLPNLGKVVITTISAQCCGSLKMVYDIPRLFRKTNREVPTRPSLYVAATLKPVEKFISDHKCITAQRKEEWCSAIVECVSNNYLSVTSDVLTSVKKMEDSLKRLKKARDKASGTSISGTGGMSDDDKIRSQLVLDVKSYASLVTSMGIDVASCVSLRRLDDLVVSARASSEPVS